VKDKDELEELMDKYGDYLKQTAFHILHDISLAEDMVQETFISYYHRNQYKGKSSPKTYLYRILINHTKMYLRKYGYKKEEVYVSQETVEIEDYCVNKMDLSYALNRLSSKYKDVLILYYYNDLSISEISDIMNCSESGVKMRLKRGRAALKEVLGGSYEENIN